MRRFVVLSRWAGITVVLLLTMSIAYPYLMEAIGFYTLDPGWRVAQRLVAKGKDARDCRKIIRGFWWDVLSPPTNDQRDLCVFDYARLTQDPSACELLMPSEYGLACISNLWPEVSGHVACGWNQTDSSFFECRDDSGLLQQGRNCEDFVDNQKQFSACLSYMAERAKEFDLCAKIPDLTIRSFCKTKMGAWEKYPSLRGSFYFGKSAPQ